MVDDIPRSIILILFLILAGGFFSGAETALSFCNSIRIRLLAEDGDAKAKHAAILLNQFDRAIVTFLVGVNIIHVVLASLTTMLAVSFMGPSGSAVATVITSLLVFIFSENIPKNIAKANSDAYVLRFSTVFLLFFYLFTPVVFVLTGLGELAKKCFHLKEKDNYTEKEFISILDNVEREGLIDGTEKELIKSSVVFNDTRVESIMTPRENIVAINGNISLDELKAFLVFHRFTRYPVYDKDLDHTIGILRADQCLLQILRGDTFSLSKFITPPLELPSTITPSDAFEAMGQKRTNFALLRTPNGRIQGILTMDDILNGLIGDRKETEPVQETSVRKGEM